MDAPLPAALDSKRRDLLQLAIGYALILAVIWSPRPIQRPLYIAAALFIAASIWVSFDGWKAMGLRCGNLLRSSWVPALALALAALSVLLAIRLGTLHPVGAFTLYVKTFWGYAIWSFAQQLLLAGFFLARFLRLLPTPRAAAIAAASIFAFAHLPNPILTVATLVWGLIACFAFLRYRNIYTLAIAHAIMGICLAITIPGPVIHNMRVGLGYLTYPRHHLSARPPLSVYHY
jgi:membrane protease YdiL (CAAX protease family)